MEKIIVSCPNCDQSMKIPVDDRLLKINCSQCQTTFIVQSGRILPTQAKSNASPPKNTRPVFSHLTIGLVFILAIALGVLSAGFLPIIKGKGIGMYILVAIPVATIIYFTFDTILTKLTARSITAHRVSTHLLLLTVLTACFNGAWYSITPDDSLVEKPLHQFMRVLNLPNQRAQQAEHLFLKLKEQLLSQHYEAADNTLTQLEDFYHYNPDRFYYFRALVSLRLDDKHQSNIYASRYLRRLGEKGSDYETARHHYLKTQAKLN